MDRLVSMQAFTRVVDVGSFAGAAESLNLPKATLTRLIQKLETHLAVKLLHRTTRRISVTTEGAAYYERCVRILADIDEAEYLLTSHNNSPRGTLNVDTTSGIAKMVLMPQLHDFCNAYPEIRLELTSNGKPINLLKEGVDVVLRVGALEEAMVARSIGWLRLALYASPIYLRRFGTPQDLTELAQHKAVSLLSNRTGRATPWSLARGGERGEVLLPSVIATNDTDVHLGCALDGHGIACMSRATAAPYVDSGRLVEIMSGWQSDPIPISAMYPQNRHLSAKVRVFVNWAADIFSRHPHFGAEAPKLAA
jgi:LysR family transcriptional regulator for bpeEF and oprC